MTSLQQRFANAALSLVDTPFRLGSHDPAVGLDCIGLVVAAMRQCGRDPGVLPTYTMRNSAITRFEALARASRLTPAAGELRCGDILVLRPSPAQHHLAISLSASEAVHAHGGLRRVVVSPAPFPWPLIARWRLA